jgi:hypothetical protein
MPASVEVVLADQECQLDISDVAYAMQHVWRFIAPRQGSRAYVGRTITPASGDKARTTEYLHRVIMHRILEPILKKGTSNYLDGRVIIFLDGDSRNLVHDNLRVVDDDPPKNLKKFTIDKNTNRYS